MVSAFFFARRWVAAAMCTACVNYQTYTTLHGALDMAQQHEDVDKSSIILHDILYHVERLLHRVLGSSNSQSLFLTGNWAPVLDESTHINLPVTARGQSLST